MATSGPRYPGTVTSEIGPSGDNDWLTASNIGADDGSEARITAATYDANDHSYRLKAQNFGFSVAGTIDGITVEIDRRAFAGAAEDQEVRLYDAAGALVGDDKQTATAWPGTLTIATYGGAADTWTASPTAAMVNDPDFGVALIVLATAANTDIGVDFIRVTVTYTPDTALVGSSAGASSGGGVLATAIRFAGTGAGAATAAAILSTSIALTGLAGGGSTAASSLTTGIALAGAAGGASTAAANLSTAIPLAGVAGGGSTAQGALTSTADTALAGTAAATSSASGALTTGIVLAGASAGASGATGVLTTAIVLVGVAAAQSGALGGLTTGNAHRKGLHPLLVAMLEKEQEQAPVVAKSLHDALLARYGEDEGQKVYRAMQLEQKGPFAPTGKYSRDGNGRLRDFIRKAKPNVRR